MTHKPAQIKVLIVDDNAAWRTYLNILLGHPTFLLSEASDGQAALDHLEKNPCDVVITDTQMPGMDGIELTRNIRETYAGLTVVLLFGGKLDPTHPMHRPASLCGANLILTKDEVEGPLIHFLIALLKSGKNLFRP